MDSIRPQLLVCPPDFFGVEYAINPWMEGNIHRADHGAGIEQWRALQGLLEKEATLKVIPPRRGLPDMVFTANAEVALGGKVVISRFFFRERRGEEEHFLRAINAIRRCGSIAAAVEQGVLTRGLLYECVQHQVPFVLAGSIRDDGPLPDTEMDLLKAQEAYARLVAGAEMILMLSTMLHSSGVAAGVKLVCVDINPAVVTKLADRGFLESLGVVTDLGLTRRLARA